jgi:hypothetical protein
VIEVRDNLVNRLMAARRGERRAKTAGKAEVVAHGIVDEVKRALGERGPAWWKNGSPDFNRHMAKTRLCCLVCRP